MIRNAPDYPSLSAAVAAMANDDILYLPAGAPYVVPAGQTLDFSALDHFTLRGDGFRTESHQGGSIIQGNVAGDLVRFRNPVGLGNCFDLEGLDLWNQSAGGTAFHAENVQSSAIRRCQFSALGVGLSLPNNCFSVTVEACKLNGQGTAGSIGAVAFSHTYFRDMDCTGCGEGFRLAGVGCQINQARIEVCGIGLNLGVNPAGVNWILARGAFSGLSFEACGTAIYMNQVAFCSFVGIGIQGSANAPSGHSNYGIYNGNDMSAVFRAGISASGQFIHAAIRIPDAADQANWLQTAAQNGSGPAWQIGG